MEKKDLIIQKIVASMLVFVMIVAHSAIVGITAITYAIDMIATNSDNVEFKAYFKSNGEETSQVESGIDDSELKLNIDVAVRNEGYLNGQISLVDSGFKLKGDYVSDYIEKIENNIIYLKQINADETAKMQVGIEAISDAEISLQTLNAATKVTLTGTYYNSKRNVDINGKSEVSVIWNIPEETKAELAGQLLTNSIYKIGEETKRVVQFLVSSKVTDNDYPIKSTQIEANIPEGVTKVEVHKRSIGATNGDKEFALDNYTVENNKLVINVENIETEGKISWIKNVKDIYVVTYDYAQDTDLSDKKITINSNIKMYDAKETILSSEEKEIKLDEEKQNIVTVDQKEVEEEIYKGKIYTGEERDYTTYTKIYVDYADAVKGLNIKEEETVYTKTQKDEDGTETTEEKGANIQYKEIKFNKQNISSVLGETWQITIADENNNEKVLTNETETDENGNIVVAFNNGTKTVTLKTSNVKNNGMILIETTKKILKADYTREEIKEFTGIRNKTIVEYTSEDERKYTSDKTTDIKVKETETSVSFDCVQQSLTSLEEGQKLQFTTVLQTNGEDKDLFKNPELKIKLPKQIKVTTAQVKLLYENGLEIELGDFAIEKENEQNIIKIKLTGEQKIYQGEAIEGTKVLVNALVEVDEIETSTTEEIVLNYTNENATKYADNGAQKVKLALMAPTPVSSIPVAEQLTSEEADLKLDLTASVGGEEIKDGDEVKAGEIIKYTVKVTNTGKQDAENVTVTATIPENTTLIEVNPDYIKYNDVMEDVVVEPQPYFKEKTDKQISKIITINSGKTLNLEYMVRVNNDIADKKQAQTKVTIKYQDKEVDIKSIVNQLIPASLVVTLMPIRRMGNEVIDTKDYYRYGVNIYNPTDEDLKNIEVTINKNELIDVIDIYYISGEEYNKVEGLTFTIDSIASKDTVYVGIDTKVYIPTENTTTAEMLIMVKDSNGTSYSSNKILELVEGVNIEVAQATLIPEKRENLYFGDEIKYIIKLKNTGNKDSENLRIDDKFSLYLDLQSITLNGEKCEYTEETELGDNIEYKILRINSQLKVGKEATIEIIAKVRDDIYSEELLKAINQVLIYDNEKMAETEEDIKYIKTEHLYIDEMEDDMKPIESNQNEEQKPTENNPSEGENPTEDTIPKYVISGIAWLDVDQNGSRDEGEKLLEGIKVYAIDVETNKIAKDSNGTEISATTNSEGVYTLGNMSEGEYIVAFEYDTEKYLVTLYQADEVSSDKNSDAVKASKVVDGEEKTFAFTDSIELKENKENIDLGLVEAKVFDLALEKVISKMIVTNDAGTKTYNFDDTDLAKVEIAPKNIDGSSVVVEYKIKIKNNGELAGYAKSIVDYMPSSLTFNSSLNRDWYQKGKYIYNDSLANTKIEPGETKELTLTLTKRMTESNTGLINNRAEIIASYNSSGIEDISNATNGTSNNVSGSTSTTTVGAITSNASSSTKTNNDISSADAIIGVKTGVSRTFIVLTIIIVIAICGIAYFVNKKIVMEK